MTLAALLYGAQLTALLTGGMGRRGWMPCRRMEPDRAITAQKSGPLCPLSLKSVWDLWSYIQWLDCTLEEPARHRAGIYSLEPRGP